MKLQTKITLFSSIFVFILIALVNTVVYLMFVKISTEDELTQLSDQTNTIVETLQDNQEVPDRNLLQAFLPSKGMIRIVEKEDDKVLATFAKDKKYTNVKAAYSDKETSQVMRDDNGTLVAVIEKPIIFEEDKIVTIQVANYLISIEESMKTLLYVLIATSIAILIPTIIAGNALSRFILQPIKAIVDTMQKNKSAETWTLIEIKNRTKDELYVMENTFNEMMLYLKDSFQKQETFVSNASHELKTPIAILKGYAQILERRGKDHPEVFDEAVAAIESETDRMEKLVQQLLLLAKSKEYAEMKSVDIRALIQKNIQTFTDAYQRRINLIERTNDNFFVSGNQDQLEQVIYILLDNALKYSEDDIEVSIQKTAEQLEIKVTDFGNGISEEHQAYIFDRFYRVDKARARNAGGTGLGLAIAKEIVHVHQGTLSVSSTDGEGTAFTILLPIL